MKNIFNIVIGLSLFSLTACENDYSFTQPAAKVEYHLEDYYGYGDVQGPPTEGSKEALAMRNKGMPVTIEDTSQDGYTPPAEISEENMAPPANAGTQVYTVSDNVGPEARIVRDPIVSEAKTVNVSTKTHTVASGETLFSISRQYEIPILPIIVINGLEPPYDLKSGQQIKIPEGKFHTVQDGETLYSISRQYGVDMSGIVKLNELVQPYNVTKGQKLQIPFPSDLPSEEKVDYSQETETVQPSVVANSEDDAGKPASLRRNSGGVLGAYTPPAEVNKPIDTEVENDNLAKSTSDKIKSTEPDPVVTSKGFMWPIQGKVVKKFGQQGGEYNDGINIAASAGTSVKASDSGRVVYTGNSLKSYGNLVIIKHDNGLLTAYAHMNNVNVKKDQKVSKGQSIGTVGSTGKVTSPQLYFAVRKGKEAKNPMNYLK